MKRLLSAAMLVLLVHSHASGEPSEADPDRLRRALLAASKAASDDSENIRSIMLNHDLQRESARKKKVTKLMEQARQRHPAILGELCAIACNPESIKTVSDVAELEGMLETLKHLSTQLDANASGRINDRIRSLERALAASQSGTRRTSEIGIVFVPGANPAGAATLPASAEQIKSIQSMLKSVISGADSFFNN